MDVLLYFSSWGLLIASPVLLVVTGWWVVVLSMIGVSIICQTTFLIRGRRNG